MGYTSTAVAPPGRLPNVFDYGIFTCGFFTALNLHTLFHTIKQNKMNFIP
jgi:hypothetical protein